MLTGRSSLEQVEAASKPAFSTVLGFQVSAIIIAALYLAREVLVPITVAILLSFVLSPLVELLRRIRLGRVPSVLVSVVLAVGILAALGSVIGSEVGQLLSRLPQYAGNVETKVEKLRSGALHRLSATISNFGYRPPQETTPGPTPGRQPTGAPANQQPAFAEPLELAKRYLSPVLSPIGTTGIVFVVAIFVLLQKEDLRDRMIRLFGSSDLHRTTLAMDDAARRLSRYFVTQLAINVTFGVIIGLGLIAIGVPNPILWGILSALLRFVPYIGSFISAAMPVALAAAVDPGWSMAIETIILYLVVELIASQAIEPILYGHSTGLSPLAVVISAIFWSWLWGPVGLVLSMPLTLCLVVLGRYVDQLEFLDVLLGDRAPLTPVESFYQRILADDADEAQDHAELLLKDQSLSSYYDNVALKGMQLAAHDAERGALSRARLEKLKETVKELVEELGRYDDKATNHEKDERIGATPKNERERENKPPLIAESSDRPSAWRKATPVLCIAGRGPLDEAASTILAQLLQKHGLGARVLPYAAVSRSAIASLDTTDIAMVCISFLDISGNPTHLRYLMRRLKERLPNIPILIGLWPIGDATSSNEALTESIGASYYTTSLQAAVDACMKESLSPTKAATDSQP
jgi:predicted PurR-regulated permease PerM